MGKNKATKVRLDTKHCKKNLHLHSECKVFAKTLHMQDNIVEIGKYILQPQKYRAFIPHRFPPAGRIEFNDRIAKTFKDSPGSKSARWRVFTYPGHGLFFRNVRVKRRH